MIERRVTLIDIYLYPENDWSRLDLSGYRIEATDGEVGKVDEASHEIGSGAIIVNTGPWIFGKKVMLPVGVISRIDEDDRRIWVNLTKDQVKDAPDFIPERWNDASDVEDRRADYNEYYRPHGW